MKVLLLATLAIVGWTNSAPLDRSDILQAAKEAAERGYEVQIQELIEFIWEIFVRNFKYVLGSRGSECVYPSRHPVLGLDESEHHHL